MSNFFAYRVITFLDRSFQTVLLKLNKISSRLGFETQAANASQHPNDNASKLDITQV